MWFFWVWLLSPSTVFSGFLHLVVRISTSFHHIAGWCSVAWLCHILCLHQLIDKHLWWFHFWWLRIILLYTTFCVDCVSVSLGYIPRRGIARSCDNSMFSVWGTARLFSKWLYHFIFPLAVFEGTSFSRSFWNLNWFILV